VSAVADRFVLEELAQWSPETTFTVERERVREYAAATNDPVPAHRDGTLAPPVFAVVPVWDTLLATVLRSISPDIGMLAVHGEQDIRINRPIVPGMELRSRGAPVGVHSKPSGTTLVSRYETRETATNELVNEQVCVTFFRGVNDGIEVGDEAPIHEFPGALPGQPPAATVVQHFDDDQTYRYSKASGDLMPIHLDENVATSVGLPGIIIHGLCTMAYTSWAAIEHLAGGDPLRLRRLAVRFSRPVLPGDDVTTRFWPTAEESGATTYGFEMENPAGQAVIKDGLAEVAS
jgi:acyl dehydratase